MRPIVRLFGVLAVGVVVVASSATPAPVEAAAPATPVPPCVDVRTEARYVPYGYNHIVILTNRCALDATCTVTTDVNPTPIDVVVRAASTTEVITFMASPQPSFVATVSCDLDGPRA